MSQRWRERMVSRPAGLLSLAGWCQPLAMPAEPTPGIVVEDGGSCGPVDPSQAETSFDCSGFTQYVFDKVGISLPHTAEQQRQFATPVSSPQPGDLVFSGAPAHRNGLYAGNGIMWDPPRTGNDARAELIWSSGVTSDRV